MIEFVEKRVKNYNLQLDRSVLWFMKQALQRCRVKFPNPFLHNIQLTFMIFRSAGGSFGKMEAAREEQYFRRQVRNAFNDMNNLFLLQILIAKKSS